MAATERVVVYLEPQLKADLERVAKQEGRTLSSLLRWLAAEHVRQTDAR